jgi:uridine kinase
MHIPVLAAWEESMKVTFAGNKPVECTSGKTILEIIKEHGIELPPWTVAVHKDNRPYGLSRIITEDCCLEPITMKKVEGRRIYQKSLALVLLKAFHDTFPGKRIQLLHSMAKGVYCRALIGRPLSPEDNKLLHARMAEIIASDLPFEEESLSREKALEYFTQYNLIDKVELLQHTNLDTIRLTKLADTREIRYFPPLPSTSWIHAWDLILHSEGFVLRYPTTSDPSCLPAHEEQKKLSEILSEDSAWAKILEVTNVGELNRTISNRSISDVIKIAEALHEKKIACIADEIANRNPPVKFILIAGPSSAGKTTFSKRLAIQLRVNGIKTANISTDDYFLPREKTPRLPNGDYNFEDISALNLELFNTQLSELFEGRAIMIPKFNFTTGLANPEKATRLELPKEMPVIIEGIHCLNDQLTPAIRRENKYLVYISALTQLNIDDSNRIPTTDNRLLRRIVRDSLFRNYSALETLRRWPAVRAGEEKNIFPFQEEADIMFNSAQIYELAVLRNFALPRLMQIPHNEPEYSEARRLVTFLTCFLGIDTDEIPPTSILREFIGNSSFQY